MTHSHHLIAKKERKRALWIDPVEGYHQALELVKKAGFVIKTVSMQTETCYFYHPARGADLLLRVSQHRFGGISTTFSNVVASITISPKTVGHSELSVFNRVATEIGFYFLKDKRPPKYRGKRGTWEANGAPPPARAAEE